MFRMAPEVVTHRLELLHTCMQDLIATNPDVPSFSSLRAFLDPRHITCPDQQDTSTMTGSAVGTTAGPDPSIGQGLQGRGSRIRLLTDLPVRLTDRELMQRQQGCCAGCTQPLPSGWLGRLHSKVRASETALALAYTLPAADAAVRACCYSLLLAKLSLLPKLLQSYCILCFVAICLSVL